jgi:hypothetical protein
MDKHETYYRPENWTTIVKKAVEAGYKTLNTSRHPHNMADIDKVLIETGAQAILVELIDHGCPIGNGESFELKRKDHTDHIEGPGWFVFVPFEEKK